MFVESLWSGANSMMMKFINIYNQDKLSSAKHTAADHIQDFTAKQKCVDGEKLKLETVYEQHEVDNDDADVGDKELMPVEVKDVGDECIDPGKNEPEKPAKRCRKLVVHHDTKPEMVEAVRRKTLALLTDVKSIVSSLNDLQKIMPRDDFQTVLLKTIGSDFDELFDESATDEERSDVHGVKSGYVDTWTTGFRRYLASCEQFIETADDDLILMAFDELHAIAADIQECLRQLMILYCPSTNSQFNDFTYEEKVTKRLTEFEKWQYKCNGVIDDECCFTLPPVDAQKCSQEKFADVDVDIHASTWPLETAGVTDDLKLERMAESCTDDEKVNGKVETPHLDSCHKRDRKEQEDLITRHAIAIQERITEKFEDRDEIQEIPVLLRLTVELQLVDEYINFHVLAEIPAIQFATAKILTVSHTDTNCLAHDVTRVPTVSAASGAGDQGAAAGSSEGTAETQQDSCTGTDGQLTSSTSTHVTSGRGEGDDDGDDDDNNNRKKPNFSRECQCVQESRTDEDAEKEKARLLWLAVLGATMFAIALENLQQQPAIPVLDHEASLCAGQHRAADNIDNNASQESSRTLQQQTEPSIGTHWSVPSVQAQDQPPHTEHLGHLSQYMAAHMLQTGFHVNDEAAVSRVAVLQDERAGDDVSESASRIEHRNAHLLPHVEPTTNHQPYETNHELSEVNQQDGREGDTDDPRSELLPSLDLQTLEHHQSARDEVENQLASGNWNMTCGLSSGEQGKTDHSELGGNSEDPITYSTTLSNIAPSLQSTLSRIPDDNVLPPRTISADHPPNTAVQSLPMHDPADHVQFPANSAPHNDRPVHLVEPIVQYRDVEKHEIIVKSFCHYNRPFHGDRAPDEMLLPVAPSGGDDDEGWEVDGAIVWTCVKRLNSVNFTSYIEYREKQSDDSPGAIALLRPHQATT